MADQVAIQLPKTVFNERSNFTFTAYFRTRSTGAAATPTTVHYKLVNLSADKTVQDWTTISAAANISQQIVGSLNQIEVDYHPSERMELLVAADKGADDEVIGSAYYKIMNVRGRKN